MTTTTIRAAAGLRACWLAAQLLAAAAAILAAIAYEHRQQIRAALVAAVAATYVAGQWTRYQAVRLYRAGGWCRLQLLALSDRATALLPQQPIAAAAPITACLAAIGETLQHVLLLVTDD
jgi:predicted outer membrane lipoprotein